MKQKETDTVLIILGDVPAKKNMYRMGRGNFYLPKEIGDYQKDFNLQCRQQLGAGYAPVTAKIALYAVFYTKRDKDLDNMLNGLMDALQSAKVIENDRDIIRITASKEKDSKNPRVEMVVELLKGLE